MDNHDADLFTVSHVFKMAFFTVIDNVALIIPKRERTAEHIHQSGFTSAIFTYDGVNLAAFNL